MTRRATPFLITLLLLAGCASTPRESFVTLEPDGGDWWRATWHLASPAAELRFDRPATGFRKGTFLVLTPGYAFALDDDQHEVLRTNGKPSRRIAVRFRENRRHLPKEYRFFEKFSDDSVAVYSGHLLAEADGRMVRKFRFVAPRGSRVVVGGKSHDRAADWVDTSGQGTYVYFGTLTPVESEHAIAIVDPGLPDWLEATWRDALPRLFTLYAEKLGAELTERPTVLFNWIESEQSGYSNSGGTLPGQIQLAVEGSGWKSESPEGMRRIFHFLAHEAAHIWNGQIIHYPDMADAWMHEGGADALAERAMLELGLMDEAQLREYQTVALNHCRRGLGKEPLRTAGERGNFELYYGCGNAIALLTDASVSGDVFAFWRALIAHTLKKPDLQYQPEDYIAVWRALGATDADVAVLRAIVERPVSAGYLVDALQERGIAMRIDDDPPQDYGQQLARDALLHLLDGRCRGSFGFQTTQRGLVLSTPLHCEGFTAGAAVTAIGGYDVLREGHRVWDALHARCSGGEPLTVTTSAGNVEVPCTEPVPPRPPYMRIVSRP